jgi:PKD repeat protein
MYKLLITFIVVTLSFSACKKSESLLNNPIITDNTPDAKFSTNIVDGAEPLEYEDINLTTASTDENATYFWDFGDGTTSSEKTPALQYALHGNYTIRLTVTNSNGLTSTFSKEVVILCKFTNGNHNNPIEL